MGDFKFKPTYEKDRGPIVRWIATAVLSVMHMLEKPLYNYALMYEATWEDEEEESMEKEKEEKENTLSEPQNQMVLSDDEDWYEDLTEELL